MGVVFVRGCRGRTGERPKAEMGIEKRRKVNYVCIYVYRDVFVCTRAVERSVCTCKESCVGAECVCLHNRKWM